MAEVEEQEEPELFPRWFSTEDCDPPCRFCEKQRSSSKQYDKGTFGVVMLCDGYATKKVPSISHKHGMYPERIVCPSALREIVAFTRLGNGCPQLVRHLKPIEVDENANTTLTLEKADVSLLYFAMCHRFRRGLPGFEYMSVHFVLWSLLRAVAYMNHCDLMHRDIKPGNVLVFGGPRVALCDFGGVRSTKALLHADDMLMSDEVCTKHYAPPEEAKEKHSEVFDSYSVAATVIHYTMSGAPMYDPRTKVNLKTFVKYCKGKPHLLSILRVLSLKCPTRRLSCTDGLSIFESTFPSLVQRFKVFTGECADVPPVVASGGDWNRVYHHFSSAVWPCLLECARVYNQGLPVLFLVLNFLCNLTPPVCTELKCYVMYLPEFFRTACAVAGSALFEEPLDLLEECHRLLSRHRCQILSSIKGEAMFACQQLVNSTVYWQFPPKGELDSVQQLQTLLHL